MKAPAQKQCPGVAPRCRISTTRNVDHGNAEAHIGNTRIFADALKEQRPGEKCVLVLSATAKRMITQVDAENILTKLRKGFDIGE